MSEGSGENIFVVRDGKIHTPPLGASRAARHHARYRSARWRSDLGIPVVETMIPREMLYIADEVFFSGTAAEITPIRSIDRITIGKGRRGPMAEQLQKEFFGVINGSSRIATAGSRRCTRASRVGGSPSRQRIKGGGCATRMTTSPEIRHPDCAAANGLFFVPREASECQIECSRISRFSTAFLLRNSFHLARVLVVNLCINQNFYELFRHGCFHGRGRVEIRVQRSRSAPLTFRRTPRTSYLARA